MWPAATIERGDELSRQLNCTYVVVPQLISYVHVPIDIIHPLTSQFVVRTRKGLLRSATVQIGWMELLAPAAAGRERDNGGQLDKERCNGSSFVPYRSTTLLLTCLYSFVGASRCVGDEGTCTSAGWVRRMIPSSLIFIFSFYAQQWQKKTKINYLPAKENKYLLNKLEMRGIDPRTSRMLSERSTIWATSPGCVVL